MKSKVKGKKKIFLICVSVFLGALFLVTLFICVCSFLPFRQSVLVGATSYEVSELLGCTDIKKGALLYSIDLDGAEEAMLEGCPYIDSVKLKRKFPDTLVISVVEKIPQWYIEVSGDCYVLDTEYKVITESSTSEALVRLGVPKLVLPSLRSAMRGEVPDFGADETEIRKSLEVVYAVQTTALKYSLTLVEIESRFDINMELDGKYRVYMGDCTNISEKLRAVEAAIDRALSDGKLEKNMQAEIYAANPESVSVKPIY